MAPSNACGWISRDADGRPSCVHGRAHSQGNGSFTLANTYATSVAARDVRLGDIDHNGQLDVLLVGLGGGIGLQAARHLRTRQAKQD